MKILIAADSFKDAADSSSVCNAIKKGWELADPQAEIFSFPMADGGEGLIDILKLYLQVELVSVEVDDALRRKKWANYLFSETEKIAIIEVAQAIGLQDLDISDRNPLYTSSFGVGELIFHAIQKGAKEILIGLGGSATNDAGMGMADALGWQFLNKIGEKCEPIGKELIQVDKILRPEKFIGEDVKFEVLCDVENPLFGLNGAAFVFAAQKGANEEEIKFLDYGLKHFYETCIPLNKRDSQNILGAGAAGGLGFGTNYFLGASLKSGIELIMKHAKIEKKMREVDLVITGEGSLDKQTLQGKLIQGICKMALKKDKPVIAVCGALKLSPEEINSLGLKAAFSISNGAYLLPEALKKTEENLILTSYNLAKLLNNPI